MATKAGGKPKPVSPKPGKLKPGKRKPGKAKPEGEVTLSFRPLTPSRWKDLETLFGERGACGGCWCMWWRLTRSEWERRKGPLNKRAFKRIVNSGEVPGIIAYAGRLPVGWCAVAPRESFSVLERSRVLKPVDDTPVWSIVCLFIARPYRGKGVARGLVEAAVEFAGKKKAKMVEAYPVEPRKGRLPDAFAWMGTASLFRKAGFKEVLRRSKTRPIMRRATAT
jgi:GNAT superfamily N-acetyltransferase